MKESIDTTYFDNFRILDPEINYEKIASFADTFNTVIQIKKEGTTTNLVGRVSLSCWT